MVEIGPDWRNLVSVVLVTFNSADVILNSIRSVPLGVETIVVDNASTDETVSKVIEAGGRCICNKENIGFSRASNIGAAGSDREFILFLNPDAELHSGALESLMSVALRFPDAGAIGPKLVNVSDQLPWRYSSVLHPYAGPKSLPVEPEAVCCVPLLTGAVLLCRRAAFDAVCGFDENIFLYHDDDDLSLRLTRAGWSLIYEPEVEVFHASGSSSHSSLRLVRFKSEQHLISCAYVSKKYNLGFDLDREFRKAIKRLVMAVLKLDLKRFFSAMGRLDALRSLRT